MHHAFIVIWNQNFKNMNIIRIIIYFEQIAKRVQLAKSNYLRNLRFKAYFTYLTQEKLRPFLSVTEKFWIFIHQPSIDFSNGFCHILQDFLEKLPCESQDLKHTPSLFDNFVVKTHQLIFQRNHADNNHFKFHLGVSRSNIYILILTIKKKMPY